MNKNLFITKRNGQIESIDLEKIHRVIIWAAESLTNINISQLSSRTKKFFAFSIKFRAVLWILQSIIERRTNMVFVYVFILNELYADRPNNKDPPISDSIIYKL